MPTVQPAKAMLGWILLSKPGITHENNGKLFAIAKRSGSSVRSRNRLASGASPEHGRVFGREWRKETANAIRSGRDGSRDTGFVGGGVAGAPGQREARADRAE